MNQTDFSAIIAWVRDTNDVVEQIMRKDKVLWRYGKRKGKLKLRKIIKRGRYYLEDLPTLHV